MFTALVSLIALMAGTAQVLAAPDTATLVTTLGQDTIAIESYRTTRAGVRGDLLLRAPRTVLYHYDITLRPDGGLSRSTVDFTRPGDGQAQRIRTTITVRDDSALVDVDSAGIDHSLERPVSRNLRPGLMTGFASDYGLYISLGIYEAIVSKLGSALNVVHEVPVIDVVDGSLRTKQLVRRSTSDVDVDYFGIAWTHLTLDAGGNVERANASGTTEQTQSVRTGAVNIDSATNAFVRRDRAGQSLGQLSPPASAMATVGGATFRIRYNSPRKRGRVILGTTVPFGQVWRTGANAATELIVDRAVAIGGKKIPAGTYTLWTVPTPHGVTLIINGQHGQWGTNYDPTKDIVRVPMHVQRGEPAREDFTISLSGNGSSGELRIAWADFVWSVVLSGP
jgi:Protein of unknown function (DUF2911)